MVQEIALSLLEVILVVAVVEVENLAMVEELVEMERQVKDILVVQDVVHHHLTVEQVAVAQDLRGVMGTIQEVHHQSDKQVQEKEDLENQVL